MTASLDEKATALIEGLILELGLPVVWVSHDPAQVRRVAQQCFRLEEGRLREVSVA